MSPDVMRKVAKPLLFSAALIWGSTFVMIKDTLDSVPTFYLIAMNTAVHKQSRAFFFANNNNIRDFHH